jgi:hypothetical protein
MINKMKHKHISLTIKWLRLKTTYFYLNHTLLTDAVVLEYVCTKEVILK